MLDLTGQRFGRWTVLHEVLNTEKNYRRWTCECSCGTIRVVAQSSLRLGTSTSCGCISHEKSAERKMDLTGERYGKLTVVGEGPIISGKSSWDCRCDCGNITTIRHANLRSGGTKSCGCLRLEALAERKEEDKLDLTNERYGRLVVLYETTRTGKDRNWTCRCDCGNMTTVMQGNLRSGTTMSCGCYLAEISKHAGERMAKAKYGPTGLKYGNLIGDRPASEVSEYRIWESMRGRCYNPNNTSYEGYGGRGIGVCDRWRDSFENFYNDMGPRPSTDHSIDRIDNDGDYTPNNCRWATNALQSQNTRKQRMPMVGVREAINGKWCARITVDNEEHHLGTYETPQEAIQARKDGEQRLLGRVIERYYTSVPESAPDI